MPIYKSSRPDVFYKICVLKNFTKFTGKHLCQSLFFNKYLFKVSNGNIRKMCQILS